MSFQESPIVSASALMAGYETFATTVRTRYRFADFETEAAALDEEREHADDAEQRVGRVVFASDD